MMMDEIEESEEEYSLRIRLVDFSKFTGLLSALAIVTVLSSIFIGTELTTLIFDVVLTAALIWVYSGILSAEKDQVKMQQSVISLQDQQSKIMKKQQDLMGAQNQPHIQIEDWELFEQEDTDYILLQLTNVGTGIAAELQISCQIYIFDEEQDGDGGKKLNAKSIDDLNFSDFPGIFRDIPTMLRPNPDSMRTSVIPNDGETKIGYFRADKRVSGLQSRGSLSIGEVMELLNENGYSKAVVQYILTTIDYADRETHDLILGRKVSTSDVRNLSDCIDTGEVYSIVEEKLIQ